MKNVTSQWLKDTNAEFKNQGITDGTQKIKLAEAKWRKENVLELLKDKTIDANTVSQYIDKQIAKIQSYFLTQTTKDRGIIQSQFVGIFYFYGEFWEFDVPLVAGGISINFLERLKMPIELKSILGNEEESLEEFAAVYADSIDYGYGIEEIELRCSNDFAKERFKSADKHLKATIALLNQEKASSKALEDARMSIEIFLKAYLAEKENLTDQDLRKQIGHDLEKAINKCINNGLSELTSLKTKLDIFPDVQARYESIELTFGELWDAYRLAQEIGTAILRNLTGRDARKFIKIRKLPSGNYLSLLKYFHFHIGSQYPLSGVLIPENFRDVLLNISSEKLDEIIKTAVSGKISGLDVLKIDEVMFATYGTNINLENHITIDLEFKSYEDFEKSFSDKSSSKSYTVLDFYANEFGFTEILQLTDGLEVKIYIEKKYIPKYQ